MSQKAKINSKAIWTLDSLVCFASAGIGAFWGMGYEFKGIFIGGVGGLVVAIVWCYIMRLTLRREWHWFTVFVFAAVLGEMVGMVDGAVLHLICWNEKASDFMIPSTLGQAVNMGIMFGLVSGLINGAFWGMFYGLQAYKPKRKLKGALENV